MASASYILDRTLYDARLDRDFRFGGDGTEKHLTTVDLGSRLPTGEEIDTQLLWNAAESAENRKNSRPARKVMIALPVELDREAHLKLVDEFRQHLEKTYRVATTAGIHYEHEHNPHCHILFTTREVEKNQEKVFLTEKTRVLDDKKTGSREIEKIREAWELTCNRALELAQEKARIDRRSYARQGVDITPGIHIGMKAYALERKGRHSERIERAARVWRIREQEKENRRVRQRAADELARIERYALETKRLAERVRAERAAAYERNAEYRLQTENLVRENQRNINTRRGERIGRIPDIGQATRARTENRSLREKSLQELLEGIERIRENREIKAACRLLEERRER